jgi:phenylalanyl-tRNA synthetase alpha chain
MSDIKIKLEELVAKTILGLATADEPSLREIEIRLLGRKGEMNAILSDLPSLPPAERAELGAAANLAKQKIAAEIDRRRVALASEANAALAQTEWIDTTEPAAPLPAGHIHPVNATIDEIIGLFERLGFRQNRYREAEFDHYAFEALNMPKNHPARDDWETFFLAAPENRKFGKQIMTPHTSNAQTRELERREPPIRMISVGKTYRRQSDVTHATMFHQFEGLVVDKGISLAHLRGVMDYFAKNFFGPDRVTRLRPHHFKFTEPSFEVDISCGLCKGTGNVGELQCRVCKSGWLELGGAGVVHPNVLKLSGVDPKVWSGFAFGWGVERTMMMRAGLEVPDIRLIYGNDLRFLNQF